MEALLTKKKVFKSSITKAKNEIEKSTLSKIQLELYERKCNKFENENSVIFNEIFSNCDSKDFDKYAEEQSCVQDSIDELWVVIKQQLLSLNESESKNNSFSNESKISVSDNVRLPKLNLPTFSGNIKDWLSFRDLFKASIHNNLNLSESQKLSYLKLSLQGEAARIIQSISISDANYKIAWDLLEERFSNVKDQVFAHLQRFISIPAIQSENPSSILKLIDTANESIRSLETLEQKVEGFSETVLAYMLLQKLDSSTKLWWERECKKDELPKISELIEFLKNYARTLQASKSSVSTTIPKKYNQRVTALVSSINNNKCICCKGDSFHSLNKCFAFKNMSVKDRMEFVKKHKLCFNCLSINANNSHSVRTCTSTHSCNLCGKRHNTMLHFPKEKPNPTSFPTTLPVDINTAVFQQPNENRGVDNQCLPLRTESSLNAEARSFDYNATHLSNSNNFVGTSINCKSKEILLSTALVYIKDVYGNLIPANALLDNGSQSCFMTTDFANKLGLKKEKINVAISCLNERSLTVNSKLTTCLSNGIDYVRNLEFLIVPKINNITPGRYFKFSLSEVPQGIKLADVDFNKPKRTDILLGAECFYELLKSDKFQLINSSLIFQNSVFGYIVGGSISQSNFENTTFCGFTCKVEEDLNPLMKKFFEIENSFLENEAVAKSKETVICDKHFEKTHRRDATGRYIVQIPFKENPSCIGESKQTAIIKLNSLWKRLERDPSCLKLYSDFLKEYERMNHMELVNELSEPKVCYYMPHHAVLRPEKSTTKLRVVFNASSPTSTGISLNSIQYNGGLVQEDLFGIMVRFRKHYIAFTADIKQMYRMILIDPVQRDLQRIVWKESADEPIKVFKLSTITYGTTSAPYLATKTLKQLSLDEEKNFPLAAKVTMTDFYMDDVVTGCPDLQTAKELKKQLISLLERGGMSLHKWASNNLELLPGINHRSENYSFTVANEIKALGILWRHLDDEFSFKVSVDLQNSYTKRNVLSNIARLFDPLGLIGPVIAKAKIFMKRLWLLNLDWTDPLPEKENLEWHEFLISLEAINHVATKRCVIIENCVQVQLHGFADASENAYGAVIYVRSISSSNEIAVNLLCSKSKVAPIKKLTVPRLELCASVLLAQLMNRVVKCLQINISEIHMWSDSTIVLAWIKNDSQVLKTFVSNRVAVIQELSKTYSWHHVRSEENPADAISRGLDPRKIIKSDLWWCGPSFLKEIYMCSDFPNDEVPEKEELFLSELKKTDLQKTEKPLLISCLIKHNNSFFSDILNLCDNYVKILRILVFICRFIHNLKKSKEKKVGPITAAELQRVENMLVQVSQEETFGSEIKDLNMGKNISKNSKLKSFNVFIDEKGILRIGGRLKNANISAFQKHPAVLSNKSKFTGKLVEYYHKKYFHAGPSNLLSYIRQRFWPINGRSLCRKIVSQCVICCKAKPVTMDQIMGDLPADRVNPTFPFNVCGVDFCGPFTIKIVMNRKSIPSKIYVSLFVCFVTRAIHLELVSDLTSESFIAALKRFFSRRGKSAKLFSDNATNFVGANIEIKKLHSLLRKPDEKLSSYLASEGIDWRFLPPRAPNFGGLWEAGVKSLKYHLKRVMGSTRFTFEELQTVVVQIEGILNSRPLTPLSSDEDNFEVLTPSHFLLGRPVNSLIEPDLTDLVDNRLSKWQRTTKVTQLFWKKWHREYLCTLQQRNKWMFQKNNVKLGSLVLIKEDNLPPYKWSMGRIIELVAGEDSKVRVVKLKTSKGIFTRAITKICLLPIEI